MEMSQTKMQPIGYCKEGHPGVFNSPPAYPSTLKPGQLTKQQFDQFFKEGYVLINNFFDHSEIDPARSDIDQIVDDCANKLYSGGKIKELYKEYGHFQRLSKLEEDFPGANILVHKNSKLAQSFKDLMKNDKLLNVSEQLLGTSDIVGNPIWNLRAKTPSSVAATVPWHQDSAYCENSTYNSMVVTAWIPFIDSNERNGCMQVARYGHKTGKIGLHTCCANGTWYVMLDEDEMQSSLGVDMEKDIVTCEVPYGGVLLFSNALPHRSLNNCSDDIRWSLDLRWQAADAPIGFWNLKPGIRLRSSTNPELEIDWDTFNAVDRGKVSQEYMGHRTMSDEFDTTIQGPWMDKWHLTHLNRHTDAFHKYKQGNMA